LIAAATSVCKDLGLRNGAFNVEMKFTATGPKLIEGSIFLSLFFLSLFSHSLQHQ
jgi:hypothetical protein